MDNLIIYSALYLVIINLITFFLFWNDKRRSKKAVWRIPEKTLLGLCVVGGSVGGILGMRVFHHKTKHLQFSVGMPIILILQVGLFIFLFMRGF
ncbi:MAG: DUF1294 domain-containing protein [Acetobacterium sp.]|nr:DUF1294 domain-containing protein [Bacillota bacterium]MCG2728787.1 DUF1294 domain-containing protein [Acetobacterium sp.]